MRLPGGEDGGDVNTEAAPYVEVGLGTSPEADVGKELAAVARARARRRRARADEGSETTTDGAARGLGVGGADGSTNMRSEFQGVEVKRGRSLKNPLQDPPHRPLEMASESNSSGLNDRAITHVAKMATFRGA